MRKLRFYIQLLISLCVFISCEAGVPVVLYKETPLEKVEANGEVTETKPEKEPEGESESEKKTETEKEKEIVLEPEKEPEIESEPEKESGTDTELEKEPEITPEKKDDSDSEPVTRKWTFMIYMAADNSLESYGIQDLNEIESGLMDDPSIKVVTLVDRHPGFDRTNENWDSTRLYEMKADKNGNDKSLVSLRKASSELDLYVHSETELDSGSGDTLKSFIEYCVREYEAENYVLVLWGLGSGWKGICYDGTSNSLMKLPELRSALAGKKLDYIIFDTSFGMTLETLYELKDLNSKIAGFPGVNNGAGINYESFFRRFCESDRSDNAVKKALINNSGTNICILDTSYIKNIFDKVNDFGKSVSDYIDSKEKQKSVLEDFLENVQLYKSSSFPCEAYVDILDMARCFKSYENDLVSQCAEGLYELVNESVSRIDDNTIGIHLIPYLSSKVPDQLHSEYYVANGEVMSLKCAFVNNSAFWCPTGKNKSLLDALFYRVLN